MLIRECAGGVVFHEDRVLLLHNDKGEWVLPKGPVPGGALSAQVAQDVLAQDAGVTGRVLGAAGETSYEFYSITRRMPVNNRVMWYLVETDDPTVQPNPAMGYDDGGFFPVEAALERITYSSDRALLGRAWARLCQLRAGRKTP